MGAIIEQKSVTRESLDWWKIANELEEIGVPFLPLSWEDEFLMAENLQNYFAEVVAGYSLLELEEENKMVQDIEKLASWEKISNDVIRERSKYYNYSLSERQKLLIWLMKEAKKIEKLRS